MRFEDIFVETGFTTKFRKVYLQFDEHLNLGFLVTNPKKLKLPSHGICKLVKAILV